jgi:hypothetical protein
MATTSMSQGDKSGTSQKSDDVDARLGKQKLVRAIVTVVAVAVMLMSGVAIYVFRDSAQQNAEAYQATAVFLSTLPADSAKAPRPREVTSLLARGDSTMARIVARSRANSVARPLAIWALMISTIALVMVWLYHFGLLQYHRYRSALESLITARKQSLDDAGKAAKDKSDKADAAALATAAGHISVAIRDLEQYADKHELTPAIQARINEALTTLKDLLKKISDLLPKSDSPAKPAIDPVLLASIVAALAAAQAAKGTTP